MQSSRNARQSFASVFWAWQPVTATVAVRFSEAAQAHDERSPTERSPTERSPKLQRSVMGCLVR